MGGFLQFYFEHFFRGRLCLIMKKAVMSQRIVVWALSKVEDSCGLIERCLEGWGFGNFEDVGCLI